MFGRLLQQSLDRWDLANFSGGADESDVDWTLLYVLRPTESKEPLMIPCRAAGIIAVIRPPSIWRACRFLCHESDV